ncbi:carboxylating nicotinate-nucleotide diphosphorylase [Endomicrobium proavitum]|uniref:Probable nicotinate-nucleotide pyrophosphorylase [carboxylating] n=1 Tax=Endomicrobium proavitum TaxID=1408281 RepID=A0A0G3WJ46_9BACT|nr:carboxylating nicotinate-nucleotide diphosphorylase [Endomicrobium proavitum]AKL97915.1 putative nicotinate-nucleotide pyrophosphorylase [carboxylating] [Endomicrobium proavitum]
MNLQNIINSALEEDGVFNDITTREFISKDKKAKAVLIANKGGVLCGVECFIKVFKTIDKNCKIKVNIGDCSKIKKGDKILEISGRAHAILSGERTALNFLQHLSGIASITNEFVTAAKGSKTKIYDTRKTIPGYRELAKYAVRCGGGANHRMGLFDMVLIKDNHISLTNNLTEKINNFRRKHKNILVEVECENSAQVGHALQARADIIMLDNMGYAQTKKMIELIRKYSTKDYRPEIELSGGINRATAKKYAKLNAERISIGMITHSAPALDITLETTIN